MTGSAVKCFSMNVVERCVYEGSPRGGVWGGERVGLGWAGRLADDGKRLCDPIAARDVVYRVAPQDKYL